MLSIYHKKNLPTPKIKTWDEQKKQYFQLQHYLPEVGHRNVKEKLRRRNYFI